MKTNEELHAELGMMIHRYLSQGWTAEDILFLSMGAATSSIKELKFSDKNIDDLFRKLKKVVKKETKNG